MICIRKTNSRMRLLFFPFLFASMLLFICPGCSGQQSIGKETDVETLYVILEQKLISTNIDGSIDFESMEIDDHQYVSYLLKSEIRRGNVEAVNELVRWLVEHSDDDSDGQIGWGLGQSWDAFGDGSINPKWHTYAIETVDVMDSYMDAIDSGYLDDELLVSIKKQLRETVMVWNQKYWSENCESGDECFYWYSISPNDAIGCINIDAKMVGTQARILDELGGDLFTKEEKAFVYDRIDKTYNKIIKKSYIYNGAVVWNYLESDRERPNDVIHHGFILEGISDYKQYRLGIGPELEDS